MVPPECWVLMGSKSCTVSSASIHVGVRYGTLLLAEIWISAAPMYRKHLQVLKLFGPGPRLSLLHLNLIRWSVLLHVQLWQLSKHLFSEIQQKQPEPAIHAISFFTAKGRNVSSKASTWIGDHPANPIMLTKWLVTSCQPHCNYWGPDKLQTHLAEHSPSFRRIWTKSPGMTCIITNVSKHLFGGLESYPHQQKPAKGLHLEVQSSS